ncbi:Golgi apyrase [Hypsizygus marmoreus]|uniref:Golgi apyrase n=1 Tax=Hypsizygus marmoreus TaxID=39966 RepID=A0A369JIY1_HYPMA|nr:Golgi apyrase [Hypsizygus marmoreus]
MPPPSGLDPWMVGRHFGIVIDAGSSGSRLQIYSWKDPRSITVEKSSDLAYTLPKVEKGTQHGEWVSKVEPGISSFASNPEGVGSYLRPFLSHAREHIPPSLEKETPLFLLATAGMRLLPPAKQAEILQQACKFLVLHSAFKIDSPSATGPCGSSVRIITGEEEGLFGWIAVNYLMDGFTGLRQNRTTYGFLDMGGASTQIAFEPSQTSEQDVKNLVDVRLRLMGGQEIKHKVFVTTWLGYGTNQARERYVGQAVKEFEVSRSEGQSDVVPDPCLPKDLQLTEKPVHTRPATGHISKAHCLKGTGSFEQCVQRTATLLNKSAPCPDTPCLMNGIHVPPIDFSVSHFIGVSEYWYSSEHIFGLGGAYDFVQYERAASNFCSRPWDGILKEHEESKAQHRLGGDGEVEEDGKVVDIGKWTPKVERSRLEMQCFKAAWITNVLHEGIGMPRLTDPGGNVTSEAEKVVKEAEKKGLGRPAFQSLDTVGDIAITWTLGKMVLEASKEVPSLSTEGRPLVDPIDDIPDSAEFPIKPIRPPFLSFSAIEDRISPHLPIVLTRNSLGFSPVLFLFLVTFCVILVIAYPLRRQLRSSCLRSVRHVGKRDEGYSLEEGTLGNSNGYVTSPTTPTPTKQWLYPFRRVLSLTHTKPQRVSLSVVTSQNPNLRHMNTTPRTSPTRSYSLPNGFESTASSTQYAPRNSVSRSPSPSPAYIDETHFLANNNSGNAMPNGLSSTRSRNTSQMNLSGIITRQTARNGTFQSTGKDISHDE